jgi:hypothetical protein
VVLTTALNGIGGNSGGQRANVLSSFLNQILFEFTGPPTQRQD